MYANKNVVVKQIIKLHVVNFMRVSTASLDLPSLGKIKTEYIFTRITGSLLLRNSNE